MKLRNISVKIKNYIHININRMKLNIHDFTIISNNCWGGFIYQNYGLKYRTPTIGLYFLGDDFVKFCSNFEYYLAQPLRFMKWTETRYYPEIKDQAPYPVARLDDVEIYFMHYHSEEEAMEKWERRKMRINRDKLIFKLSQREYCSRENVEAFMALPHKYKICFAYDNVPGTIYVPALKGLVGDEQPIVMSSFNELEFLNEMRE